MKYKWDNQNVLDYAVNEGFERGIEQGIERGIEQGEHNRNLTIARKMKKQGVPFDQIAAFTELPIKEIENL